MHDHEVTLVFGLLTASWPTKEPLDPGTIAIWGSVLAGYDYGDIATSIKALLETSKWRPSLAEILEPLQRPPPKTSALEAFANVWEQIGKQPPLVTALEAEAVRRLGGWGCIRGWLIADRHWHTKRFVEVYEELIDDTRWKDADLTRPALPASTETETPALPAAGETAVSFERIAELMGAAAKRFRSMRDEEEDP